MERKDVNIIDFLLLKPHEQIDFAWYDWFCSDRALVSKGKRLVAKLQQVVHANWTGRRFDPRKCYVFFKNNCPMVGTLYDDFRICSMETGDVDYTIVPATGHVLKPDTFGRAELWDISKPHDEMNIIRGHWKHIIQYFKGEIDTHNPRLKPTIVPSLAGVADE